jgi:septum formation protein
MTQGGYKVVLASASPRRRRLFAWLGIEYSVMSTDTDEDLTAAAPSPSQLAVSLAEEKAAAASQAEPDALVLAFDTIVVLAGGILGKPVDLDDARRMLRALSGRSHEVVTGVSMLAPGTTTPQSFAVATPVSMRVLDETAIEAWVDEGELLGCAGAYNIERHLADVDLDQCFQNVAGLPLCHLYRELRERGLASGGLVRPVGTCDLLRGVECRLGPELTAPRGPSRA